MPKRPDCPFPGCTGGCAGCGRAADAARAQEEFDARVRARKNLSQGLEFPTWPPRVGDVYHVNSGYCETSWEDEVRAVVDDDVLMVRRRYAGCERTRWEVVSKTMLLMFTGQKYCREGGIMFSGKLPQSVDDDAIEENDPPSR